MNGSIFRREALERLASPEQLDQLMPLTSPRGWVALAALGGLLLAALLWGAFGTVPVNVEGPGVLVRAGRARTVRAPWTGRVTSIKALAGGQVVKGQVLVMLRPPGPGQAHAPVESPQTARVLEVPVREGDQVEKGDPLMALEPLDDPLEAVAYVPQADGHQVQPGMAVEVVIAGVGGRGISSWSAALRARPAFPPRGQPCSIACKTRSW
jgi:multidrug resistance efflux pump